MLLSLIVPFYNVEKYLPVCLQALECLPEDETEIILVDDCGKDQSGAIAEGWAKNRTNVQLIRRKTNGGLSAARNTGFDACRGEYVYYLDSDDIPCAQTIFDLAKRASAEKLDIIKGRFVYYNDDTHCESPGPRISRTQAIAGRDLFLTESKEGTYEPMVWQCLYRRVFLTDIQLRMAEGLLFEDELFQAPALFRSRYAAADERILLQYRQRSDSIMGSFAKNARWCDSYLRVCRGLNDIAGEEQDAPSKELRKRIALIALNVARNIPAYQLTGDVRQKAICFLTAHKNELAGFAVKGGSASLMAQGALLGLMPHAYMRLYACLRKAKRSI